MRHVASLLIGAALSIAAVPTARAGSPAGAVALDADIVVMGEEHDVAAHHRNQAAWIRRMDARAIVFEMLPRALGPRATKMQEAPAGTLGAALDWEERGWPDFAIYAPIFAAARGARIYGAEAGRGALRRAMEEGAAAAMGGADQFGLDRAPDARDMAARLTDQARAHCDLLPEALLPGMVEAQRLRDALLAEAALAALEDTGGPVAVITGNGHARTDRGVPATIAGARPDVTVISIGQFTAPVAVADAAPPHDHWVIAAPPAARAGRDPCAPLR